MAHVEARPDHDAPLYRAAVVALLAVGALVVVVTGLDWLLAPETMPVRNVRFEGEFRHVRQAELAVAVREVVSNNFLLVDLEAVRERVESIPWVHRAAARRWWPRDVYVQFDEQHIVARWGDGAWVNHVGEAVRLPAAELPADMPRLAGPLGTSAQVLEAYQRFAPLLGEHGLLLKRLVLTPRRTWELIVEEAAAATVADGNGFLLVLDREEPERKIGRFARSYGRLMTAGGGSIRQVDLRYANGFAVQWKASAQKGG